MVPPVQGVAPGVTVTVSVPAVPELLLSAGVTVQTQVVARSVSVAGTVSLVRVVVIGPEAPATAEG